MYTGTFSMFFVFLNFPRSFLSSICIYFSWSVRYILSMPWKMTRPAVARAPVFGNSGPVNYMGGNGPPSPDVIRMMPGPIIDTPWQLHHQINVGREVSRYKHRLYPTVSSKCSALFLPFFQPTWFFLMDSSLSKWDWISSSSFFIIIIIIIFCPFDRIDANGQLMGGAHS